MTDLAVKVIYIMGPNRSGSTVLGRLLGQVEGFFDSGEVTSLWSRVLVDGFLCGCGTTLQQCAVWSQVWATLQEAARDQRMDDEQRARQTVGWQRELLVLHRVVPFVRILRGNRQLAAWPAFRGYARQLNGLYHAVREASGARVIVDTSKSPAGAAMLGQLPTVSPYFLQLVRDPRAVAFSLRRRRRQPLRQGSFEIRRYPPALSALMWAEHVLAADMVRRRYGRGRSVVLRYEDFVRRPEASLRRICRLADEPGADFPFIIEKGAVLETNHTVAGNPDRFASGAVQLSEDAEWLAQMGRRDRAAVTALTLPFLRRYGYPLFRPRSHGKPPLWGNDADG